MTTPKSATSLMSCQLSFDDGKGAIRIQDVYDTDMDDLWSALTDPDRLARWIGVVEGGSELESALAMVRLTAIAAAAKMPALALASSLRWRNVVLLFLQILDRRHRAYPRPLPPTR